MRLLVAKMQKLRRSVGGRDLLFQESVEAGNRAAEQAVRRNRGAAAEAGTHIREAEVVARMDWAEVEDRTDSAVVADHMGSAVVEGHTDWSGATVGHMDSEAAVDHMDSEAAVGHMDWAEVVADHMVGVGPECTVAEVHFHQRIVVEAHQAVAGSAILFFIMSTVTTTSVRRTTWFHVPVLGPPLGSIGAR